MKPVILFLLFTIWLYGCNNETPNSQDLTSRLIIHYQDQRLSYSLTFTKTNSLILTTSDRIQKSVQFDNSSSKVLDSLINVLKQRNSDTLHFLPHLEYGGTYSLTIPFDTSLNTTLIHGENKPKIIYDLVTWAEDLKTKSFTTSQ